MFTLHHGPTPLQRNGRNKAQSFVAHSKQELDHNLKTLRKRSLSHSQIHSKKTKPQTLKPTDVAIILHTSGTTGTKKIVPILLEDLCVGAFCVAASMELASTDICWYVV